MEAKAVLLLFVDLNVGNLGAGVALFDHSFLSGPEAGRIGIELE